MGAGMCKNITFEFRPAKRPLTIAHKDDEDCSTSYGLQPQKSQKIHKQRQQQGKRHRDEMRSVAGCQLDETKRCRSDDIDDVQHWRTRQTKLQPSPSKIWQLQDEITPHMRQILVDWLFEVCSQMSLARETFLLAINYIDRCLSHTWVARADLQLLGITCLWVAAKYEEVFQPSADEMVSMLNGQCRVAELCDMEKRVLAALGFELGAPTTLKFTDYYCEKVNIQSLSVHMLSVHLSELTTLTTSLGCSTPPLAASISRQSCCSPSSSSPSCIDSLESVTTGGAGSPQSCVSTASTLPAAAPLAASSVADTSSSLPACLATALPSTIAAAALSVSLLMHEQWHPSLLDALAALAQCHHEELLQLCQALVQLLVVLSLSPSPCAMIRHHHLQKQLLQLRLTKLRQQAQHAHKQRVL